MTHRFAALALALSLVACDGGDPTDAGPDAGSVGSDAGGEMDGGVDAGPLEPDAGPLDDGGVDAGPLDAGPPTPAVAAADVMTARVDLDSAVDDVPEAMRLDGAFADLELAAGGIDALVGEDGLMTLALSDATVRALADLHQANLLLAALDRVIAALDGRAEAAAVRTETMTLRDALAEYRAALARAYRARLDAGIVGSPVVEDDVYLNLLLRATPGTHTLLAVGEGRLAAAEPPESSVGVSCFGSMETSLDVRVVDVETGVVLGTGSGEDAVDVTLALALDEVTSFAIEIVPIPTDTAETPDCFVSVRTRRRFRVAPVAAGDFLDADGSLNTALSDYRAEADQVLGGPGDATVIAAANEGLAMIVDLVAPFVSSEPLPIPVETYERVARRAIYVRASIDALLASGPLSTPGYDTLRTHLASAMSWAEMVISNATPTP